MHDLRLAGRNNHLVLQRRTVGHDVLALGAVQVEDQREGVLVLHQEGHATVARAVAVQTNLACAMVSMVTKS